MKILFVLDHYFPYIGGAETLFKNTCEGLAERGHRVSVVTTRLKDTKKQELINGIQVHRVWTPPFARRYWFTLFSLFKVVQEAKKAEVIHTTTYNSALSSRIAGKILHKPNLITILEVLGDDWGRVPGIGKLTAAAHNFFERMVLCLNFDRFVCISESTRNNVIKFGIPREKTVVNYPGVDYDLFDSKNIDHSLRHKLGLEDNFVYLFFGRPGITKGVDYLVRAVSKISKKIPKAKLVMILAHEPQERHKEILDLINKFGLKNKIIPIDPVERKLLPSYLGIADCVVVPSLTEGFGYSAAEAAALCLKIVATNVGSLPEVVSGNYILVKAKSPKEIMKGVCSIYRGEYKKTKVKRFTQNKSISQTEAIYRSLVKK